MKLKPLFDKVVLEQKKQEQKKQDAERLLEAVKNNEKNTMKENAKKLEVAPVGKIEKDW